MDILRNIKDLLYQHDCVILPDFGGFVANYIPAQVDYDRNIFSPPSKKISFNGQLTHNDGLLVSSVSQTTGLGYKDALNGVDMFTRDLKARLDKGKKVILEELGTFLPGKDNTVQFEPDRSVNYFVHSFGLSTFEFDLLEEFDVRKKIQSKFSQPSDYLKKRRKMIIRGSILAIPLLVALTVIPLKTNWFRTPFDVSSLNPFKKTEQPINTSDAQPVVSTNSENIPVSDPLTTDEMSVLDAPDHNVAPVENETVSTEESLQPSVHSAEPDVHFYVIVGSFKDRNNAVRLQSNLRSEGYDSEIFETSSGFIRVSLQGFPSYNDARNARHTYGQQKPDENFWILQK